MDTQSHVLTKLAKRYIWWQAPEAAARVPHRVIAQVMDIGLLEDVHLLRQTVGDKAMRQALDEAAPGEFTDRSWYFWHQMLGRPGKDGLVEVPPSPTRQFS